MRYASLAALVVALALPAAAQPAPVVDWTRFLHKPFSPEYGQLFLDGSADHLLFAPAGLESHDHDYGAYRLLDASGAEVLRVPIGPIAPTGSPVIVAFDCRRGYGLDGPLAPGAYVQELVFQDRVVGRVPFTVSVSQGGDAFAPTTHVRREGPWRRLAFFQHEHGRADATLEFAAWVPVEEPGSYLGVHVVVLKDGTPVAATRGRVPATVPTGDRDWGLATAELVRYAGRDTPNVVFFTPADLTPGRYAVEVRHAETGAPIQRYPFEVGAGGIVAHPRSALGYEPHHAFLTPRRMAEHNYATAFDVYWVEATE